MIDNLTDVELALLEYSDADEWSEEAVEAVLTTDPRTGEQLPIVSRG